MDMIVNSQFIIEQRKSKAWSQQHLADVSGLSLRTVQRIESSNSGAPDSIKAIAMAFSLVPADLMKAPEMQLADTKNNLQNNSQLIKVMPLAATFAVVTVLGLSVWLGTSSFSVIANGHKENSSVPDQPVQSQNSLQTNADEEQQAIIMEAALDWLSFVDSQDYQNSWKNSDPLVHSQLDAKQWQTAVEPVRGALGSVIQRKLHSLQVSTSMPGLPDGEYALLVISSRFENKAESFETVPMSKSTGQWKPMGYFIR